MERLLLVDDSVTFLRDAKSILQTRFEVIEANSGKKALDILKNQRVSAVLLDLKMPDMNGIEVMKHIHKEIDPHLAVIIVTDSREVENAVEAMREGAYDFITKEFDINLLSARITKALERRSIEIQNEILKDKISSIRDEFIFKSEAMKKTNFEIQRVAMHDFDVILIGETGVGKDLIAYEIHKRSSRRDKPYVEIPLGMMDSQILGSELFGHVKGAFTDAKTDRIGKIEAADGGTIYLPEISALSTDLQLKLLGFIQYKTISRLGEDGRNPLRKVDVRLIFASNEHDLMDLVLKGRMREDFYHRITSVRVEIPPLRDRREDIGLLAEYFLKKEKGNSKNISREAIRLLESYHWPGNVRELRNVIVNALIRADGEELKPEHIAPWIGYSVSSADGMRAKEKDRRVKLLKYTHAEESFRKEYFSKLLLQAGGDMMKAARIAGMTPQGIRKALRAIGLDSNLK